MKQLPEQATVILSERHNEEPYVGKTSRVMGLDDFDDQYRVVLDFGPDFKAVGSRPALAKMLGMTVKEEVKQAPSTDSESRI